MDVRFRKKRVLAAFAQGSAVTTVFAHFRVQGCDKAVTTAHTYVFKAVTTAHTYIYIYIYMYIYIYRDMWVYSVQSVLCIHMQDSDHYCVCRLWAKPSVGHRPRSLLVQWLAVLLRSLTRFAGANLHLRR